MNTGNDPSGFKLTEEEAFALLGLCLTSPNSLDATSERALRKLAEYCSSKSNHLSIASSATPPMRELEKAGA